RCVAEDAVVRLTRAADCDALRAEAGDRVAVRIVAAGHAGAAARVAAAEDAKGDALLRRVETEDAALAVGVRDADDAVGRSTSDALTADCALHGRLCQRIGLAAESEHANPWRHRAAEPETDSVAADAVHTDAAAAVSAAPAAAAGAQAEDARAL